MSDRDHDQNAQARNHASQSLLRTCYLLSCQAPSLLFLYLRRFDSDIEGGESLFLDAFYVAEEFRKQFPKEFDDLVRIPGTFQKIHFERYITALI